MKKVFVDLETDLKTMSEDASDNKDKDLEYIYTVKRGNFVLPYFYIKKDKVLYNTIIPIEGNL